MKIAHSNGNNQSGSGATSDFSPSPAIYLLVVVLILTAIVSILGNLLVQLAFWSTKSLKSSPPAALVMVLAIVDFSMAIFIMPFVIMTALHDKWSLDDNLCVATGFLNTVLTAIQFGVLFGISINRFMAVSSPHLYQLKWTVKITYVLIAIVCSHSLLWAIMPFLGWGGYEFAPGTLYCNIHFSEHKGHSTSLLVCCYIVPAVIAALLYIIVYIKVKGMRRDSIGGGERSRSQRNLQNIAVEKDYNSNSESRLRSAALTDSATSINMKGLRVYGGSNNSVNTEKKIRRFRTRESRVTKSLLIVAAAFAIFWLPRGMVNFWAVVSGRQSVPKSLEYLTTAFIFMNSFVNPIIYGLFHHEYKNAFRRILRCEKTRRSRCTS